MSKATQSLMIPEDILIQKISEEVRSIRKGDMLVYTRRKGAHEHYLCLEDRHPGMAFIEVIEVGRSKRTVINLASFTQNRLKVIRGQ